MFRVLLLGLIRLVAKPGFELRGGGGAKFAYEICVRHAS